MACIFDFGNNTSQYMFLTPSSYSNTLRFAITTSGNGAEQRIETTQLATGQWVHVAVTLDGDTAILYVNGDEKDTNSGVTIDPTDFNPSVNYIGKSQWPDPLFNGRIDGFRIYNYAMTPEEIMDEYMTTNEGWFCDYAKPALQNDLDGDCRVGMSDLEIFAQGWLSSNYYPDFAVFAQSWLSCNRFPEAECGF